MNERQERLGELVIARGDAPELLDATEETLDQIAALVEMPIECARIEPIGTRRDNWLAALSGDCFDEVIRVVALVGHDKLGRLILDQSFGLFDIRNLTCRENDPQRIAQSIDRDMQLGRQSAARATDFLSACFFWAPAECWCARTMVESMNSCSRSASPDSAVATRSQMPFSRQREKRTKVRCQCPSSSGRSRHGLPVRMIHSTASTKRRLSLAVTPRSLALPGSSCSIRSHWKSQDMTIFTPL